MIGSATWHRVHTCYLHSLPSCHKMVDSSLSGRCLASPLSLCSRVHTCYLHSLPSYHKMVDSSLSGRCLASPLSLCSQFTPRPTVVYRLWIASESRWRVLRNFFHQATAFHHDNSSYYLQETCTKQLAHHSELLHSFTSIRTHGPDAT